MKNTYLIVLIFTCLLTGCKFNEPETDRIITEPPTTYLVKSDSILSGAHLGIAIGSDPASVYSFLQTLIVAEKQIQYVNVVSNIFTKIEDLKDRIQLYQGILLDQKIGTDSGIQISFESGKVKNIFLNSGQKLNQWPVNQGVSSSVRTGDDVTQLYSKLLAIKKINNIYASRFERISMFTKDLATKYDPIIGQSPQWYFGYTPQEGKLETVQIFFLDGKVVKIKMDSYSN